MRVELFAAILVVPVAGFTFCLANSTSTSYSHLNDLTGEWSGRTVGFCAELFASTDQIAPVSELSCDGELGSFLGVRALAGSLHSKCRAIVTRFSCGVVLPVLSTSPSVALSLPCSDSQFRGSGTETISDVIARECSEDLGTLDSVIALAHSIDTLLQRTPALTTVCRPLNGDSSFNPNFLPIAWDCPADLIKVRGSDLGFESEVIGCALPCPWPLYSQSQYNALEHVMNVLNITSTFVMLFAIISWVLLRKKRVFPRSLVFRFMIAALLLHISLLFGPFGGGVEEVWCHDNYTPAHESDPSCGMQGALLMYAGLASSFTWLSILVNAFLTFALSDRRTFRLDLHFKLFSFGLPVLPTIIALAANKIDYAPGAAWCFVTADQSGAWQYGLFYGMVYSCLLIGVYVGLRSMMALSKHEIDMYSSAVHSAASLQSRVFRRKAKLLVWYVFIELVMIGAFRAHASVYESEIRNSLKEYVQCQFRQLLLDLQASVAGGAPVHLGCNVAQTPSYPLLVVALVMISFNGIFVFCLFAITQDVFMLWKLLFSFAWGWLRGRDQSGVRQELGNWASVVQAKPLPPE